MKVIRLTAKMSSTSLGTKQAFWRVEILKCTDGRGSPTYKKTKKTPKTQHLQIFPQRKILTSPSTVHNIKVFTESGDISVKGS